MTAAIVGSLRSVAGSTPLRLCVLSSLAVLSAWPALLQAGGLNTHYDAQFLAAYEEHARIAVTQFGQLPLWDPYTCGGLYGLAAPQTRYASPFFLLTLLLGVPMASSLLAVLLPALGMEGMYRYARSWGASELAAFVTAPLFPLVGFFSFAWGFGWVQFYSFGLVPWILLCLRAALRGSRAGAYGTAVWVGATVGMGGTYTLPMLVLPGLMELAAAMQCRGELCQPRRTLVRTALLGAGASTALVVAVAAFRLWPMLESAAATLRVMGGKPERSVEWLLRTLFSWATTDNQIDGRYFVPPTVALGLVALWKREYLGPTVLAALSFGLALGQFSPLAPFSLMRELPLYETLRHPERFLLLWVLAMSLLTAVGASTVRGWVAARLGDGAARQLVLWGALLALVGSAAQVGSSRVRYAAVAVEPVPALHMGAFRQSRGNRWLVGHYAAEGLGSLGCGEAYPVPMSRRLRGDLAQEEYLVGEDGRPLTEGHVQRERWSPGALTLEVDTPRPARLAINQNYHPGWHASVGDVRSWEGLLSVQLPAGHHQVTLRFVPRSGVGGALVSLVGLVAGALFAFGPLGWRGRTVALGVAPATFLALVLVWPEPTFQRPAPRTADHRPVLLDALPEGAQRLDVHFDLPLVLVGARLGGDFDADGALVELYFRRDGELGPDHSIFVHARGPGGARVGADHGALSGVVYLPKMPEGRVVRDAFRLPLPERHAGPWHLEVGVYDAFGDGHRRSIRQAAPGVVHLRDAVHLGPLEVPP